MTKIENKVNDYLNQKRKDSLDDDLKLTRNEKRKEYLEDKFIDKYLVRIFFLSLFMSGILVLFVALSDLWDGITRFLFGLMIIVLVVLSLKTYLFKKLQKDEGVFLE